MKCGARGDAPCLWLRIHTLETTYVEWGGTCEFDYCTEFAVKLDLEDHWREFEITFEEFRLERRWNDFSELDPDQLNELTNIQFFVPPSDSPNHTSSMFDYQCYTDDPFDFWVDDVSFF